MTQQHVTKKVQFGVQTLTCLLLVASAAFGLWVLEEQVQVWSFGGGSSFDAQFFPRIILTLIVVTVLARMLVKFRSTDTPIGATTNWLRVFLVAGSVIASLLLMPTIGFLAGAFLAAFVTAVAFGERQLLYNVGVPLLVAAIVSFGAQQGLNIPLP